MRLIGGALTVLALAAAIVLMPGSDSGRAEAAPKGDSIVEIAAGNPDFTTLVAAVQAAGVVDTLNGNRHFTVFAPTNDAFADIGLNATNIDEVPTDALTDILLYHVTPGNRTSKSVLSAPRIKMTNSGVVHPALIGGVAQIEAANSTATIVAPDIKARNGVVHVIDAVLLP